MHIFSHRKFKKSYLHLSKEQQTQVDAAIRLFTADRTAPALHDHPLKGTMKRLRAFSAGFDLRVIYREEGGFVTIILLDAGSPNQVY